MEQRPLPNAEHITAGSDGRVYRHGVPMYTRLRPNGYLQVRLGHGGVKHDVYVHHVVLNAWHGPCPPMRGTGKRVCRHLNGDKTDNRPENLRWGTPHENNQDTRATMR